MEPLGPLRADAIFSDMSRELYNNFATLSKKGHDMDRSAVSNNTITTTEASNSLENWYQSECLNTPLRH